VTKYKEKSFLRPCEGGDASSRILQLFSHVEILFVEKVNIIQITHFSSKGHFVHNKISSSKIRCFL